MAAPNQSVSRQRMFNRRTAAPPAKTRPSPRPQLVDFRGEVGEGKRLNEEGVGPQILTPQPLARCIFRRQNQDRFGKPLLPEFFEHFKSALAGKHQIENHKVHRVIQSQRQALFAGLRREHVVLQNLQPALEAVQQMGMVFNDEDARHSGLPKDIESSNASARGAPVNSIPSSRRRPRHREGCTPRRAPCGLIFSSPAVPISCAKH